MSTITRLPKRSFGFTLIELLAVVCIIGVLMAAGLVLYNEQVDDARRAGVQSLAGRLAASVAVVHMKWVIEGQPKVVETEGKSLVVNGRGWPIGIVSGGKADNLNACQQLWQGLFKYPSVLPATKPQTGGFPYWAPPPEQGRCRFYQVSPMDQPYYVEYQMANGEINHNGDMEELF